MKVAQVSIYHMLHDGYLESTAAGVATVPRNSVHGGASGAENNLPWEFNKIMNSKHTKGF